MTGTVLGNFEILEEIGRGGMGVVYRARQLSLDRVVALKVLTTTGMGDDTSAERFQREALAMAHLQHPGIVDIIEVGQQDDLRYFAMQYVEGESLESLIRRGGCLDVEVAAEITAQIADALQHAHERGVVHRDIKPANILIKADGRAVVTDFGIAKAMEGISSGHSLTQGAIGTPEYMSPEVIRGNPFDGRADIYSLSIVTYQMLTGRVPFSGTSPFQIAELHLTGQPAPLGSQGVSCPPWLESVILRGMMKEPADRFPSADEMAAALRGRQPSFLSPASAGMSPHSVACAEQAIAAEARPRAFALAIALAVLGCIVLGAAVVLGITSPRAVQDQGSLARSSITVPSVAGLPLVEARRTLEAVGLTPIDDGEPEYSSLVTEQMPSAGQQVAPGTAITLSIEPGDPDVAVQTGQPATQERLEQRYWAWLDTWESKDLELYLSFYSEDCEIRRAGRPSYGKSLLETRLAEDFAGNAYISIESAEPTIELTGDTAMLSAWQEYDSPTWWDEGTKTLGWTYMADDWYISSESFAQAAGGSK
jgi:serine/threonine-protein kinase